MHVKPLTQYSNQCVMYVTMSLMHAMQCSKISLLLVLDGKS